MGSRAASVLTCSGAIAIDTQVPPLLVPQGRNRIEASRAARRVVAERESDAERDQESDEKRRRTDERVPAHDQGDQPRSADAGENAGDPAERAQDERLDQELRLDRPRIGADRLSDA